MSKDLPEGVLDFWFREASPAQWFQGGPVFDALITDRFKDAHARALSGEFDDWAETPRGALALCILLDQFPRNMFRGTKDAFASDEKALAIAKNALEAGFDSALDVSERRFLYLPYEHSEELEDQKRAVSLFAAIKDEDPQGYDYALRHLEVIEKYGRFPHRNKILGRVNTPAEEEYLAQDGAGF
ncbi:MAG: DUF924 family protein [Micavibrio sp.]